MQHFYDGQIRRYVTQIVRALSKFSYKDGDGDLKEIPVMYGDLTRQVANIMRDNSENKLPSAPRMAVYITALDPDRTRTSDFSFISKANIREKEFDESTNSYVASQAKGYTVERLHPIPYQLTVNVDVWSTNTDQKLQILEQIFMLFNPSLEFQTTDNYLDWTSLTILNLESTTWSSRSIPAGTESEIDVSTLTFTTPIWISPPTKVKKLGIISDIITGIYNLDQGTIELDGFTPETGTASLGSNSGTILGNLSNPLMTSYRNFDINVSNNTAQLVVNRIFGIGDISWYNVFEAELPAQFQANISQIELNREDLPIPVLGTFDIDDADKNILNITWIEDTLPTDTSIEGPARNSNMYTSVDRIINPQTFNPTSSKVSGLRYLLTAPIGSKYEKRFTATTSTNIIQTGLDYYVDNLDPGSVASGATFPGSPSIGDFFKLTTDNRVYVYDNGWNDIESVTDAYVSVNNEEVTFTIENRGGEYFIILDEDYVTDDVVYYELNLNNDGPDAWKSNAGDDFLADSNDIIEWDGSKWNVIFNADNASGSTYTTNLHDAVQYVYTPTIRNYWYKSIDGHYPKSTWRIVL